MHDILAVHQDQDEAVRSLEDREATIATTLRNFEVEAVVEKIGKSRNIADGKIHVIEFQHSFISIAWVRAG
jgi:nitrogen regulatory protein PII